MINRRLVASLLALSAFASVTGCSDYHQDTSEAAKAPQRASEAQSAIGYFRSSDPSISKFFDSAYGYAVFPKITKGAAGVGAANGSGVAYQGGNLVGTTTVTQVTIGAQLGGQTYRQIIFFQDASSFNRFKNEQLEFNANASAVIVKSGAAKSADYQSGVAIFAQPIEGAMAEASVGGQKFTFRPL